MNMQSLVPPKEQARKSVSEMWMIAAKTVQRVHSMQVEKQKKSGNPYNSTWATQEQQ